VIYLAYIFWVAREYSRMRPRIVPYVKHFRTHKPSQATTEASQRAFRSGFGIAADLLRLDESARKLGVPPLSSFGFGDDLLRQPPQWTDPAEGLRTLTALISNMCDVVSNTTITDLETLLAALEKARETQDKFSLIGRR